MCDTMFSFVRSVCVDGGNEDENVDCGVDGCDKIVKEFLKVLKYKEESETYTNLLEWKLLMMDLLLYGSLST